MVPEATAYHERSLRATPDLYAADVRILLEAGELTSAGDYLRAQRARTMMRDAWARMFDAIDVLAAPTVPMTATEAGRKPSSGPMVRPRPCRTATSASVPRPTSPASRPSPCRSVTTAPDCRSVCS